MQKFTKLTAPEKSRVREKGEYGSLSFDNCRHQQCPIFCFFNAICHSFCFHFHFFVYLVYFFSLSLPLLSPYILLYITPAAASFFYFPLRDITHYFVLLFFVSFLSFLLLLTPLPSRSIVSLQFVTHYLPIYLFHFFTSLLHTSRLFANSWVFAFFSSSFSFSF